MQRLLCGYGREKRESDKEIHKKLNRESAQLSLFDPKETLLKGSK